MGSDGDGSMAVSVRANGDGNGGLEVSCVQEGSTAEESDA